MFRTDRWHHSLFNFILRTLYLGLTGGTGGGLTSSSVPHGALAMELLELASGSAAPPPPAPPAPPPPALFRPPSKLVNLLMASTALTPPRNLRRAFHLRSWATAPLMSFEPTVLEVSHGCSRSVWAGWGAKSERERERESECVCVCEREREESESDGRRGGAREVFIVKLFAKLESFDCFK